MSTSVCRSGFRSRRCTNHPVWRQVRAIARHRRLAHHVSIRLLQRRLCLCERTRGLVCHQDGVFGKADPGVKVATYNTDDNPKHRYPTSKYADRFHNNVMPSDPVALPARASPITTSINDTILITALVFSLHKVRQNPRLRGREVKAADVQKRLCHLASAEERPLAIILLHLGESMIRVDVALMPPCIGKRWLRLSRPRMSNPARDDVSSHSFKAVGGVPPSGHDNHRTHHIARHSRVE